MVPSLALMSQTVSEWKNDSKTEFRAFAVCSDGQVGTRRSNEDIADLAPSDLAFPATTDSADLAAQFAANDSGEMTVVAFTINPSGPYMRRSKTMASPNLI